MNTIKRTESVEEKMLRQYQSFAALFEMLSGHYDITKIRRPQVKAFRADLAPMPESWGKSPKDQALTCDEVMAKAAALTPVTLACQSGLSTATLITSSRLRIGRGTKDCPLIQISSLPSCAAKRPSAPATSGTPSLWTISVKYLITQCGPDHVLNIIRHNPEKRSLKMAYTGARPEEIAGLSPSDIMESDGVVCLSIEVSELRRIKNLPSPRLIPIHSHVIGLGLLNHVQRAERNKQNCFFAELYKAANDTFGRKVGRRIRQVIDQQLGANGQELSFHRLRHYVLNQLEDAGVDDKVVRDIIGYHGKDIHKKVYRQASPILSLVETLQLLLKII